MVRYTSKDMIAIKGYYFKCLKCNKTHHQSKMNIAPGGVVVCPKCSFRVFEVKKNKK